MDDVYAAQKHTLGCRIIATNNFISRAGTFGLWFRFRIKRFQLVEWLAFC